MNTAPLRWAITGTDTGIGKTTVTRGILRALVNEHRIPRPLKWIETGCSPDDTGQLVGEDTLALARAAKRTGEEKTIGPIRLRLPAGPVAAAQAEQRTITEAELRRAVEEASRDVEFVLIEGAGGALVPLTNKLLFVDACRQLANTTDFVLVTRDGLGTIHHTLATFEALRNRDCKVHAVVVNQRNRAEANDQTNSIEQLRHWLGTDLVLGPIPPIVDATDDQLAEAVEAIGLVERVRAALPRRA